jgi:uncharacterized membrane protein
MSSEGPETAEPSSADVPAGPVVVEGDATGRPAEEGVNEGEAAPQLAAPTPTPLALPPIAKSDTHGAGSAASAEVLADLIPALLVLLGVGCSLGAALYASLHFADLPALVTKNTMTPEQRSAMLRFIFVGGVLPPLAGLLTIAWRRSASSVQKVASVSRLVAPLVLAALVPVLFNWRCFAGNELLLVIAATGTGLLLERLLRVSFRELAARREARRAKLAERAAEGADHSEDDTSGADNGAPNTAENTAQSAPVPTGPKKLSHTFGRVFRRVLPYSPLAVTVLLAAFSIGYLSYFTILNHYRLQTSSWDLAIFDNMMWNLLRGEWFKASPDLGRTGSHIQYHANFVAYFLLPFYALRQQADTMLFIQALFVGLGTIPLYLLTKARTGSAWLGALLAFAYCFHAPQHGPAFYDFHFLTFAPFFVWWVLYFFETGKKGWLVASWLLALLVREDVSACLSAAALFLLISRQRPWWAFFGGLFSAVYFVAMKFGIMPLHRSAADKQTFVWMFKDLVAAGSNGYGGVLKSIATNPVYTLNELLEAEKLSYVLKMFGPVLLLPLRSAKTWLLFVPAALFTLLSSGYKPLYQTFFQYTSNWTPYLFFGTAVVLHSLGKGVEGRVRQRAAAGAIAFSVLLFSFHHGAIIGRDNFRGGFRKVQFEFSEADKKKYQDLKALIVDIPKNASVAATETEAPHVSNREDCFTLRFGHDNADYLLVSISEARVGATRKHFTQAVSSGQYGFLRQSGNFMLWKRGAPQDRNAAGLKLIGPEPPPARRKK